MEASSTDKRILRELAMAVAEIAATPEQKENARRWTRHNDLERGRPMVLAFPEGAWRELLPDATLACEDETCPELRAAVAAADLPMGTLSGRQRRRGGRPLPHFRREGVRLGVGAAPHQFRPDSGRLPHRPGARQSVRRGQAPHPRTPHRLAGDRGAPPASSRNIRRPAPRGVGGAFPGRHFPARSLFAAPRAGQHVHGFGRQPRTCPPGGWQAGRRRDRHAQVAGGRGCVDAGLGEPLRRFGWDELHGATARPGLRWQAGAASGLVGLRHGPDLLRGVPGDARGVRLDPRETLPGAVRAELLRLLRAPAP